jgi:hypothetical protein
MKRHVLAMAMVLLFSIFWTNLVLAAHVDVTRARTVAENWLHHQVWAYSDWIDAGGEYPRVKGVEQVRYENQLVAYNFQIHPQGYVLVPARDELPPVKLYSTSSNVRFGAADLHPFLDAVLLELYQGANAVRTSVKSMHDQLDFSENSRLWAVFSLQTKDFVGAARAKGRSQMDMLSVGPLVTTTWGQGDPYNLQTPKWSDGRATLVGCVATAAAQVMRYHRWPTTGQGTHSYSWNNGQNNTTLSRNFATRTYDWANMPNSITASSPDAQKNAVAMISADAGIAFSMRYGVDVSSASTAAGARVLPQYFRYKNTARFVERNGYASDSAWMGVFKTEVENQRPALFSIAENQGGQRRNGHSVVVSGYRDAPQEQIHINMGWYGNSDGWYASNNINTGRYNFNWVNQGAVIGIEPDRGTPPPPGNSCPAKTMQFWQCSGPIQAGDNNVLRTVINTRAGYSGRASYRCTNGRWVYQQGSGSCTAGSGSCPAKTMQFWQCSGPIQAGASNALRTVVNTRAGYTGRASYRCTGGRWVYQQDSGVCRAGSTGRSYWRVQTNVCCPSGTYTYRVFVDGVARQSVIPRCGSSRINQGWAVANAGSKRSTHRAISPACRHNATAVTTNTMLNNACYLYALNFPNGRLTTNFSRVACPGGNADMTAESAMISQTPINCDNVSGLRAVD